MMELKVKCSICDEKGTGLQVEQIIDEVRKANKTEVNYKSTGFKSKENDKCYELDCEVPTIKAEGNVYFIFDNDKLLYVGKSLDVSQRLRQHLIKCNKKTYSKIQSVQTYLEDNDLKTLSFCVIRVTEERFYGTIEGMIIKYIHDNQGKFPDNWNLRED